MAEVTKDTLYNKVKECKQIIINDTVYFGTITKNKDTEGVVVEGVNIVTKHTKPSAQNTKGGIVKVEAPINISNIMLWDAKKSEPTKVKRTRENGKLIRVSKKSGEVIK